MANKSFLKFIAYLQVLGIILVVLGHSLHEFPDGAHGTTTILYRMIYTFHMPLFIFVSGFLLYYTTFGIGKKISWKKFSLSKLKRLLIPYTALSLVTFIPRAKLSNMADDPISFTLESFWESILYSDHLVIPYFWFLQISLFLLTISYGYLLVCHRLKIPIWVTIPFLILVYGSLEYLPLEYPFLWALNTLPHIAVFFSFGIGYAAFQQQIDRYINWENVTLMISFSILWIVLFLVSENTAWAWLCSLVGITMCISIAKFLVQRKVNILDHLIGANYLIFLLSWYFNVATQQILHHYTDLPWWVYSLLSLICGIYIPWLFYRFMLRHQEKKYIKILSITLGQSRK